MSVRTLGAVLMCGLLLAIPVAVAADPEPDLPACLADDACALDDAVQAPEGTQAQVEPDRLSADADERLSDAASPTLPPLPASRSDDAPVPAPPVPTRSIRP